MRPLYVVSADLYLLLSQWAKEHGFTLPPEEFFDELAEQLRYNLQHHAFSGTTSVVVVPESVLAKGIHDLIKDAGHPVISIDRAYCQGGFQLDITRLVTAELCDVGEGPRPGCAPVVEQIIRLREHGLTDVVLVDDVIFSGGCVRRVTQLLKEHSIRVVGAIAGIVVGDGRNALKAAGIETRWVHFYSEAVDQVCQRDFFPGVPFSGRTVVGRTRDTGAPYVLPYGDPIKWASIPKERMARFSHFCTWQNMRLWEAIGRASGRPVLCKDVQRLPLGAPDDVTPFFLFLEEMHTRRISPLLSEDEWHMLA